MRRKIQKFISTRFTWSIRDTVLSIGIFICAIIVCMVLRFIDHSVEYVSMIFILAVFLISRYTTGYLYGTIFSFLGVLAVNFIFTYPYFEFNFTVSGYPLTIISMILVSIITSALTTQIKHHDNIQIEAEKEKTRSNLLRAVSHDLRTPLTSILGASSAIIENDEILLKEERIKLLCEIKEDAGWLIRMVENLLSITRIDAEHGARIVKQNEACEEVIADSVGKFKKRFNNIPVTVSVPNDLLMIPMDAVLIGQVIVNLLENVIVHAKTATKIELSVYKVDTYAVFEVSDNGCGIPQSILPRIFDGYFKQDYEDNSDKKRNMGIGLSVCHTIIKAHNGIMTAQNNDEHSGAVLRFTLPID